MFESVKKWEGKGGRRIFPTLALLGHVEGGGKESFFEVFLEHRKREFKTCTFFLREKCLGGITISPQ